MLEESITSSPQKPKASGSIRDVRLHRKNKRRRLEESSLLHENTIGAANDQKDRLTLDDIYYDKMESLEDENQINKTFVVKPPLTYGPDFDIFEDEMLLSVADRLNCANPPLRTSQDRICPKLTQGGFQKCEDLPEQETSFAPSPSPSPPPKPKVTSKTEESQFGITESELVNFCVQVEEKVTRPDTSISATTGFEDCIRTPLSKKSKSIIESILKDFCSSPLSPEVAALPVHSRPPEAAVALPQHPEDDDCLSSCSSSGLSTQEDHTQLPTAIAPINMNRSQKLYENFMNLSTHFNHTSQHLDSTPNFRFKSKSIRTYANRRSLSFARANIADEDDSLGTASDVCMEEDLMQLPSSVGVNQSQKLCQNLLKLSASVRQHSQYLDSTLTNSPIETSTELYLTALAPEDESLSDVQFFEIIPSISKLLMEILTLRQKYPVSYSRHSSATLNDFRGFSLDTLHSEVSGTHMKCRTNTKDRDCLLEDADPNICFGQLTQEVDKRLTPAKNCDIKLNGKIKSQKHEEVQLFSESDDDCDFFRNFKTQDALKLLKKCPKEDDLVDYSINFTSALMPKPAVGDPSSLCVDFRTASLKNIKISTKGQEQYAKILQEFPELLPVPDNKIIPEKQTSIPSQKHEAFDFTDDEPSTSRAALSRCQVAMPKKAKLQADKIKMLEALETGFLSSELETELEPELTKTKLTDIDFENIQLSEWLLEEGLKEGEKLPLVKPKNGFSGLQVATSKSNKVAEAAQSKPTDSLAPASSGFRVGTPNKAQLEGEDLETSFLHSDMVQSTEAKLANIDFENIQLSEWSLGEDIKRARKHSFIEPKKNICALQVTAAAMSRATEFVTEISEGPKEAPGQHAFVGFRTAAAKTIKVSAASTLKAAHILTDLPEIPLKNAAKSDSKASTPVNVATLTTLPQPLGKADVLPDEFKDIQLSEWILSPELKAKEEETREKRKFKAELDEHTNDEHTTDTPILQASKLFCKSHPTNASLSGSPVSTKVIYRKNLLSLSKSRKRKTSRIEDKHTPMKQPLPVYTDAAPGTPNLQEFFDSVPNSSTPHRLQSKLPLGIRNDVNSLDTDFQRIQWDSCNDSKGPPPLETVHQLSDSSCANVTLKERIEILSMYGNPPAVSPIAVNSAKDCRISGLRRSRRASKQFRANLSN